MEEMNCECPCHREVNTCFECCDGNGRPDLANKYQDLRELAVRLVNRLELCEIEPHGDGYGSFVDIEEVENTLRALKKLLLTP